MRTHRIAYLRRSIIGLLCLAAGIASSASASVVVGATRVIYHESAREASVSIKDVDTAPFVVQTWIDTGESHTKPPFFITPPLSRLNPGKQNMLRVMRTSQALPSDRESMYGLNVKEIPEASADKNVLQIAVRTRIKLFYRPTGLPGTPADAPKQLQWHVEPAPDGNGGTLVVHNPTPYYVTFATLHAGRAPAESVDIEYVAPFSDANHSIAKQGESVPLDITFSTINDFGALVGPVTARASR
jgi:P pilus assembly chaperone PapD